MAAVNKPEVVLNSKWRYTYNSCSDFRPRKTWIGSSVTMFPYIILKTEKAKWNKYLFYHLQINCCIHTFDASCACWCGCGIFQFKFYSYCSRTSYFHHVRMRRIKPVQVNIPFHVHTSNSYSETSVHFDRLPFCRSLLCLRSYDNFWVEKNMNNKMCGIENKTVW